MNRVRYNNSKRVRRSFHSTHNKALAAHLFLQGMKLQRSWLKGVKAQFVEFAAPPPLRGSKGAFVKGAPQPPLW